MGETDASHIILNSVIYDGRSKSAFYSNKYSDIREARNEVLRTGQLPECGIPQHDWRDGQALEDM